MTPEEIAIAEDFESGWSEERLDHAEVSWGPGLLQVLSPDLANKIRERAEQDGTSDLEVIRLALTQYLAEGDVA
ncbi:hypothetical protein M5J20_10100 [Corynebacterium sp. TA-R-1]|uniref:CopG family transcriptional regulator n=1 Tax=Corynebacterium stercoris TaxID=2943490 RepID=A0ABT1G3G5_9CORY|nr:hypothetical protein [Corynebacterium stercoris]MCP1388526.1 hypothetical protein [Corynebacterium stercoris]